MGKPASQKPQLGKGTGSAVKWRDEADLLALPKIEGTQPSLVAGNCGSCDLPFRVGDWVFRDGEGVLNGANCCGAKFFGRLADDRTAGGMDLAEADGYDFVPASQVMPYGKTKRDMCLTCFQIPAASGVCGC
jgi:hypothetical protein